MTKNYIVIITDERLLTDSYETHNLKVEFLAVGTIFHGRHFNGKRPNVIIDQTTMKSFDANTEKWAEHVISGLGNDVRVVGMGVVATLFGERYGKRDFGTKNFVEYVRRVTEL